MKTYHSNAEFKARFVEQTLIHQQQDQYIHGEYGIENGKFKGCSVGCSLHSLSLIGHDEIREWDSHKLLAEKLGWPEWLCHLQDTIFEGLPDDLSMEWTSRLANAVPVGADIESLKWRFCSFLMAENMERVEKLDIAEDLKTRVLDAIATIKTLHDEAADTGLRVARSAASAARSVAWSAVRSAERSAASAARSAAWIAESAVRSAAWSALSVAASAEIAAWSAARSAARSAAASAAFQRYADKLIELVGISKS